MNYQQLRDYALQCSLENHLCNVAELALPPDDLLSLVAEENDAVIIYEPFDWCTGEELAELIEDQRGVNVYNFLHVLSQVNGQEWLINFKGKD